MKRQRYALLLLLVLFPAVGFAQVPEPLITLSIKNGSPKLPLELSIQAYAQTKAYSEKQVYRFETPKEVSFSNLNLTVNQASLSEVLRILREHHGVCSWRTLVAPPLNWVVIRFSNCGEEESLPDWMKDNYLLYPEQ